MELPTITLPWVDTDCADVLINTVDGHQKVRNIAATRAGGAVHRTPPRMG